MNQSGRQRNNNNSSSSNSARVEPVVGGGVGERSGGGYYQTNNLQRSNSKPNQNPQPSTPRPNLFPSSSSSQSQVKNFQKERYDALSQTLQQQLNINGQTNKKDCLLPYPDSSSSYPNSVDNSMNRSGSSQRFAQNSSNFENQRYQSAQSNNGSSSDLNTPHRYYAQSTIIQPTSNQPINGVPIRFVYDTYSTKPLGSPMLLPQTFNPHHESLQSHIKSQSMSPQTPQPTAGFYPRRPSSIGPSPHGLRQDLPTIPESPRGTMAYIPKISPDELLRNFRSLECSGCQRHFGYQSRTQKELIYCAASCITDHASCVPVAQIGYNNAENLDRGGFGGGESGSGPLVPKEYNNVENRDRGGFGGGERNNGGAQIPLKEYNNLENRDRGFGGGDRSSGVSATLPKGYNNGENRDKGGFGVGDRGGGVSTTQKAYNDGGNLRDRLGYGAGERSGGGSTASMTPNEGVNRDRVGYGAGDRNGGRGGNNRGSGNNGGRAGNRGGQFQASFFGRKTAGVSSPFTQCDDDEKEWGNTDVVDRKLKPTEVASLNAACSELTKGVTDSTKSPKITATGVVEISEKPNPEKGTFTTHHKNPEVKPVAVPPEPVLVVPPPAELVKVVPVTLLSKLGTKLKWTSLDLGKPIVVSRTFANDIGDFFVQRFDMHKNAEEIAGKISQFVLTSNVTKMKIFLPDTLCLAPFVGEFYRSEILGPAALDDNINVFFSDFGNVESVPRKDCLELPMELGNTPRLITHCRWDYVLSKELPTIKLRSMFSDDRLPITPKYRVTDGQYVVQLGEYVSNAKFEFDTKDAEALVAKPSENITQVQAKPSPVMQKFVEPVTPVVSNVPARVAVSVTEVTRAVKTPIVSSTPVTVPVTTTTPSTSTSAAPRFVGTRPSVVKSKPSVSTRTKYMLKDLKYSSYIKPHGEVYIGYTWTPSRHLVVGDDHEEEAAKVQELLQTEVENCEGLKEEVPVVGEVLLAPYDSGDIYRGVVKIVYVEKRTALLEFIDYGDSGEIKFDDLRIPNAAMMKFPVMGLTVTLPPLTSDSNDQAKGTVADYHNEKMQIQFLDEEIKEDTEVALWVTDSLTLNAVIHKIPIVLN